MSWTRAELCALVEGCLVGLRDRHAGNVAVPAWLAEAAAGPIAGNSHEAMERTHPDDRGLLVGAFLDAVTEPGVAFVVTLRAYVEGVWGHYRVTWLNLIDDPDVGAIVCVEEPIDGPPIAPPMGGDAGYHDATNWMILELDGAGIITSVRGQSTAMLGYRPEEMLGEAPTRFIHPDCIGDSIALWLDLQKAAGATASSRRRWMRKDGSETQLESSYLNQSAMPGQAHVLVVVWDIAERLAQEQELERSRADSQRLAEEMRVLAAEHERLAADFRLLADELPSAVVRCETDGRVLFHNARWATIGSDGATGARLHEVVHPDDHAALDDALRATGRDTRALEVRGRDGRAWRVTLRSVAGSGSRPDGGGLVVSIEDVTATISLRRRAEEDGLTGLLNRASLESRLLDAVARHGTRTCVLFVDLDGFKEVNDAFGHAAGDAVLIELGRRLKGLVRPSDSVGRFGGDEFVVVCPDVSDADARELVARIEAGLAPMIEFTGGQWLPAASIGAAQAGDGETAADVLRRADLEMFRVKRARRAAGATTPT